MSPCPICSASAFDVPEDDDVLAAFDAALDKPALRDSRPRPTIRPISPSCPKPVELLAQAIPWPPPQQQPPPRARPPCRP